MARETTLTISNGDTESSELDLKGTAKRQWVMKISGPSALTGTITIQTAEKTGGTYNTLQSGGSDINVSAGKQVIIDPLIAGALKLVSSGAEGDDRTFQLEWHAKA